MVKLTELLCDETESTTKSKTYIPKNESNTKKKKKKCWRIDRLIDLLGKLNPDRSYLQTLNKMAASHMQVLHDEHCKAFQAG